MSNRLEDPDELRTRFAKEIAAQPVLSAADLGRVSRERHTQGGEVATRTLAAATAMAKGEDGFSGPNDIDFIFARDALAAADAVMFSDENIERAAKAAYEAQMEEGDTPWHGFGGSSYLDYFRDQARAVVAALKGADA